MYNIEFYQSNPLAKVSQGWCLQRNYATRQECLQRLSYPPANYNGTVFETLMSIKIPEKVFLPTDIKDLQVGIWKVIYSSFFFPAQS